MCDQNFFFLTAAVLCCVCEFNRFIYIHRFNDGVGIWRGKGKEIDRTLGVNPNRPKPSQKVLGILKVSDFALIC